APHARSRDLVFSQNARRFQPEQYRHHQQVARAERTIEPVGIAQASGKLFQPGADTTLDQRQALLAPGLVALQKPGGCELEDRRLHRVESGEEPSRLARSDLERV